MNGLIIVILSLKIYTLVEQNKNTTHESIFNEFFMSHVCEIITKNKCLKNKIAYIYIFI